MEEQITEEGLCNMLQKLNPKEMIILKFTAEWCAPCKGIKPICVEYQEKMPNSIKYIEIDIDESIELYMKFKKLKMVNGIPAILAYHSGEKDFWYVPDDSVLGGDKPQVRNFFDRCINYVN